MQTINTYFQIHEVNNANIRVDNKINTVILYIIDFANI